MRLASTVAFRADSPAPPHTTDAPPARSSSTSSEVVARAATSCARTSAGRLRTTAATARNPSLAVPPVDGDERLALGSLGRSLDHDAGAVDELQPASASITPTGVRSTMRTTSVPGGIVSVE